MKDFVFPKDNEDDFLEISRLIGSEPLFCYSHREIEGRPAGSGVLLETTDRNKLISLRNRYRKHVVVFKAHEHSLNRFVVEKVKPDIIFGFEELEKRDFMHQRGGSLNQVLCKLMAKNNIEAGFSFASILCSGGQERARIIGRMRQNIRICQKYKVRYGIYSFATDPFRMRPLDCMELVLKV